MAAYQPDRSRTLRPAGARVRIFEIDRDLLSGVPEELHGRLLHELTVPVRELEPGEWTPASRDGEDPLAFLVLEGAVSRETRLFGQRAVELLGPGDPFLPADGLNASSLPYESTWLINATSRIAILDQDFVAKLRFMPAVASELLRRARDATTTLAHQLAIAGIHDLAARLLVMLWHLADRWGRRESGEVVLSVPLSHALLADLVHARRPSVTKRLKVLRELGLVSSRPGQLWALHGPPPAALEHLERIAAVRPPLEIDDQI